MTVNLSTFIDTKNAVLMMADSTAAMCNLSSYITNADFPDSWKNNDVTTFGSIGFRPGASLIDTKFTVDFVFAQGSTASTGATHTVIGAMHYAQSTRAFQFYPAGTTSSNALITGNCNCPSYHIMAKVGNYITVSAEFQTDNGTVFGVAS
jgi:hypothetical protein